MNQLKFPFLGPDPLRGCDSESERIVLARLGRGVSPWLEAAANDNGDEPRAWLNDRWPGVVLYHQLDLYPRMRVALRADFVFLNMLGHETLVLEIDGPHHRERKQWEKDRRNDRAIGRRQRTRILRYPAEYVRVPERLDLIVDEVYCELDSWNDNWEPSASSRGSRNSKTGS